MKDSLVTQMVYFLVLACLILSQVGVAQTTAATPDPTQQPVNSTYADEAFVIEQLRNSYQFANDGTGRQESYARIRVQSEAGVKLWGQVVVGYNSANESVDIPYVRVLKKDGGTVTALADAIQDLSSPIEREAPVYTDLRQKHITVPGLRPGDTLEYDVVRVLHTPMAAGTILDGAQLRYPKHRPGRAVGRDCAGWTCDQAENEAVRGCNGLRKQRKA